MNNLIIQILTVLTIISSVLFSQDMWVKTPTDPEGMGVTDILFTPQGTLLVTTASFNWPTGQGGVRRTTNQGTTWINVLDGLYVSYNDGQTWVNRYYLAAAGNNIFSIAPTNNNMTIFLGTRTGVLRSTDGGQSFPAANNGIPPNSWVRDLSISSQGIIAAATTNGVFISSNNGSSWLQTTGIAQGDTATKVEFVTDETDAAEDRLLIGTQHGRFYEATNENEFLNALTLYIFTEETYVTSILRYEVNSYLVSHYGNGIIRGGVTKSTNGGSNFTAVNEGLPNNPRVSSMGWFSIGEFFSVAVGIFGVSQAGAQIYIRLLAIGIQQISSEIPMGFSLSQNYPNPFNPATKLKFQVPYSENVRIAIYDALGKEVEVLVNKQLTPGTYETDWDASKFSSGIYYYRMTAGKYTDTKKMILVK